MSSVLQVVCPTKYYVFSSILQVCPTKFVCHSCYTLIFRVVLFDESCCFYLHFFQMQSTRNGGGVWLTTFPSLKSCKSEYTLQCLMGHRRPTLHDQYLYCSGSLIMEDSPILKSAHVLQWVIDPRFEPPTSSISYTTAGIKSAKLCF